MKDAKHESYETNRSITKRLPETQILFPLLVSQTF